ncbi:MAG TPA: hypothetical protein P5205_11700 [Candidatus Paceibacterota bacterium]|nr:hypothetical protein [Verrucomicrobiota bacterium]HSA11023.1 hypothetical protein [Candidatus Paceibacterota bacterium]
MDTLQLEMALLRLRRASEATVGNAQLVIQDTKAIATSPEGASASMPLELLLGKVAAGQMSTGPAILPDGIKAIVSQGPIIIWAWEHPPRVYQFEWIANDSPRAFGQGTKYRKVRLALPYVIVLAVFLRSDGGLVDLLPKNECFFRSAPLKRFEDELCYPALLNCSKFKPPEGQPLSWICTQHLRPTPKMHSSNPGERFLAGFEALRHCLLETAFNYSSEHHEGTSWFSESRKVDPRLKTVEAWEQATGKDPLFVLEVPWLKTGHTLRQVIDRIFTNLHAGKHRIQSAAGMARMIFNHAQS